MNKLLIIALCIIPNIVILWYIYLKDKIEKEPFYLLLLLFIEGLFTCVISIIFSTVLKKYIHFLNLPYTNMNILQIIFKVLFTIAIVEEGSKWIINYITIWKNINFKHIYDPIVYSTFISIGFATLENIIYGITFSSYGIIPIIMRGFISVPCHAVFGIYMGYYLGISKNSLKYNKKAQSIKYRFLSIIIPTLLHLLYDLFLIKKDFIIYTLFIIYIVILYILAYQKIEKLSSVHKNFI